mmetsp:Transcript_32293/g.99316  ORF Transcript_32293/g.99316 Transcript_32293/m.99316 type:complete len:287 (+) Transcript_32293:3-863(+)
MAAQAGAEPGEPRPGSGGGSGLQVLFHVFEWDDIASVEEGVHEDEENLRICPRELAELLPIDVTEEAREEVTTLLEEALLAAGRPGAAALSPTVSPTASSAGRLSPRCLNDRYLASTPDSPRRAASSVLTASRTSAASAYPWAPASRPASARSASLAGPQDSEYDSLVHASGTSSVYALNESGDSQAVIQDAFQLDFQELMALGQGPGTLRLTSEEAQALPRVHFEDPELQSCSICIEFFRQGMLLTGLGCGHVFHVECLAQWVQRAAYCPNCRAPIRPGSHPSAR